jgi:acyl carrier protein
MLERTDAKTKDQVALIVRKLLGKRGLDRSIGHDDNLRDKGLSSTDMVNLILTVEEEFGITIPERQMTPTNFRSISSIDALVSALLLDR